MVEAYVSKKTIQRFRSVVIITAILVFLLIVVGGIVSASGAANACPDWPTCLGTWMPPQNQGALYNYAHRVLSALVAPFLIASAWIAWRQFRNQHVLFHPILVACISFAAQIGLGASIALFPSMKGIGWLNVVHLQLSLLTLAGVVIAGVASFYPLTYPSTQRLNFSDRSSFSRYSIWLLISIFALLTSGAIVKASDIGTICTSWPLCNLGAFPQNPAEIVNMIHRVLVGLSGLLMGIVLLKSWRGQRTQTPVLAAATATAVLFFAQALLGAKLVQGFPAYLIWLHQTTAVASWGSLIVLVTTAGLANRAREDEQAEEQAAIHRKGLLLDFLMLTKPIVVALLLVTTYAGMVIAGQQWPSLSLTFWTLLGGFLAAGGSGAINQFIDRFDDEKMQRTQKRPIPSGRLTAGEGLAFGVGLALASFYLMVAFVNLLAALLTLTGIVYYVLLYSIFLKKTTVQNIVIGGGAGAIPPLVGWAAVTGSLNIPSLFLFAIVFMWTPPHFWALALVRRKDYARAGVPMLPVVRGEKETRAQIMLYTIELVALTLLLPLFGLGGSIYLIGAAVLGGWLVLSAWQVWKKGGNKLAWKMYRYSSMYLAFLFVVLMIDRLV